MAIQRLGTRNRARCRSLALLLALLLLGAVACGEEATETIRPSVAVLPCEDLSPDPDDPYLAAGLHDEILLRLAKISGLISIGRSSVEYFRDNPAPLNDIAAKLSVDFIGECSVRKEPDGEHIRLTFQLLEPSGAQVWAENYDAALTAGSLLEVESDVAQQVATAIGATLTPEEEARVQERPTDNAQAYELFMRGRRYFLDSTGEVFFRSAARLLHQATELDPEFAEAHASLAFTQLMLWWYGWEPSVDQLQLARNHLELATSLKPEAPLVHRVKGHFHIVDNDFDRAIEEFNLALDIEVDPATVTSIAVALQFQGRQEEALTRLRQAAQLDPVSPPSVSIGIALRALRRFAEAEKEFERLRASDPNSKFGYTALAALYVAWQGDTERARSMLQAGQQAGVFGGLERDWVWLEIVDRDFDAALARLSLPSAESVFESDLKHLYLAQVYAALGQRSQAVAHYDSARAVLEETIRESQGHEEYRGRLGIALAGLGRKEEAIRAGRREVEESIVFNGGLHSLATIYTMVGEHDSAVDILERLLSSPDLLTVQLLRLDPTWDPLRDHPRFVALSEEYGD